MRYFNRQFTITRTTKMFYRDLPYFAYGSNLDLGQMQIRCKFAQVLGAAELPDYELTFNGVADVVQRKGSKVSGGLFRITNRCLEALDRYEGYPFLYDRKVVEVIDEFGEKIEALVYVMQPGHRRTETNLPSRFYFEVIERGFTDFGLNTRPLYDALERVTDIVEKRKQDRIVESAYRDEELRNFKLVSEGEW